MAEHPDPPVETVEIDMKTLADTFNQGVAKSPSYEFSNHREFTQESDKEVI